MKVISYLSYFFYIAWNWNPLLALFIIYHEIRGERKYRIETIGRDELKHLKDRGIDISHSSMYMPVNYYVLEQLMKEMVKLVNNKTFLDIGCGKGRVIVVAAAFGFEKITGIDFSKEFCEETEITIRLYRKKNPGAQRTPAPQFTIVNRNASCYEIPGDITSIFLFNPFDEVIMRKVVANIKISQQRYPRTIRVLYANPLYRSLFLDDGFVEIYHLKKLNYFEGVILQRDA